MRHKPNIAGLSYAPARCHSINTLPKSQPTACAGKPLSRHEGVLQNWRPWHVALPTATPNLARPSAPPRLLCPCIARKAFPAEPSLPGLMQLVEPQAPHSSELGEQLVTQGHSCRPPGSRDEQKRGRAPASFPKSRGGRQQTRYPCPQGDTLQ